MIKISHNIITLNGRQFQTGLTVLYSALIILFPVADLAVTFNIPGVPSSICSTYNILGKKIQERQKKKELSSNIALSHYISYHSEYLTMA